MNKLVGPELVTIYSLSCVDLELVGKPFLHKIVQHLPGLFKRNETDFLNLLVVHNPDNLQCPEDSKVNGVVLLEHEELDAFEFHDVHYLLQID